MRHLWLLAFLPRGVVEWLIEIPLWCWAAAIVCALAAVGHALAKNYDNAAAAGLLAPCIIALSGYLSNNGFALAPKGHGLDSLAYAIGRGAEVVRDDRGLIVTLPKGSLFSAAEVAVAARKWHAASPDDRSIGPWLDVIAKTALRDRYAHDHPVTAYRLRWSESVLLRTNADNVHWSNMLGLALPIEVHPAMLDEVTRICTAGQNYFCKAASGKITR
ncbi:MAG: hypothetical protein RL291_130 [Pseudomonadota bacterium]|jgi:hypothetical protein